MRSVHLLVALLAFVAFSEASLAEPVTYQGRLDFDGTPADGLHELTFTLYDSVSGGSIVAGPLVVSPLDVDAGLFSAELDFPADAFASPVWLQISARSLPAGVDTLLSPRQLVTAAPASIAPWRRGPQGPVADTRVGIGAPASFAMLEIDGSSNTDVGLYIQSPGTSTGDIQFSSPNGVPGVVAFANNGNRRDIRFGEIGMNLTTSPSSAKPSDTNGLFLNESGNIGIGTAFPSSRLDVEGAVSADNYSYSSVQTRNHTIPAAGFSPDRDSVAYANTTGLIQLFGASSSDGIVAPLMLPDGAVITGCQMLVIDNAGVDLEYHILRTSFSGSAANPADINTVLLNGTSSGSSLDVRRFSMSVATGTADRTIDNANYSYSIEVGPGLTSNTAIVAARVIYTVASPD